ncbi:MAG: hypothetical protein WBY22_01685, partial [Nitrososphaeraceae archaeon]
AGHTIIYATTYIKLLYLAVKHYINYEKSKNNVLSGKMNLAIFNILVFAVNQFETYYLCQHPSNPVFLIFAFILSDGWSSWFWKT